MRRIGYDRPGATAVAKMGPFAPVVTVVVLAVVGAILALGVIGGDEAAGGRPGKAQRTSFGSITVLDVGMQDGVGEHDMGGMMQGVQSLVPAGRVDLRISVRLTNTSRQIASYSPGQFRLRVGDSGDPVRPSTGTLPSSQLNPGSSVDARMSFVTAADGSAAGDLLTLEFADQGGRGPVVVPLGPLRRTAVPEDRHDNQDRDPG